jgi:ABC-2 type transport system permease protein
VALSWRLQRGQLIGWAAGLGALGLLLGSVIGGVSEQLDSPAFRELSARMGGDGDIGQMFFQFVVYVLAQVTSAAALASVLALRGDETSGLAEMILVRPVSRTRWAAGQLLVSITLAVVVLSAIGLGAGVSSGQLPGMLGTTLAYAPAVAVIIAIATALIGWLPRIATPVSWTLLAIIIVMDLFAEFGLIGPSLMRLSPYAATFGPVITGAPLALPLTVLTVIAAALIAFGLIGLSRRDVKQ